VFIIAMYVPNIMQGVVQGASRSPAAWRPSVTAGRLRPSPPALAFLAAGAAGAGFAAAQAARAAGSSVPRGGGSSRHRRRLESAGAKAAGSAAKEKAIGSPGAYAGSILGLANAKLDQKLAASSRASPVRRNATTNRKFKTGKTMTDGRNAPPRTRTLPRGRNGPNDTAPYVQVGLGMAHRSAFLSLAMAVIGFSYAMYLSTQVKLVPYIVEVDKLGNTVHRQDFPEQIEYADARVVRATLGNFVTSFRSITPDAVVQKQYIDRTYALLRTRDPSTQKINSWFRGNSPFEKAKDLRPSPSRSTTSSRSRTRPTRSTGPNTSGTARARKSRRADFAASPRWR
jgi:hypothetical protein